MLVCNVCIVIVFRMASKVDPAKLPVPDRRVDNLERLAANSGVIVEKLNVGRGEHADQVFLKFMVDVLK